MNIRRTLLVPTLLVGLAVLWGCSDNSVNPQSQELGDEAAVTGVLAALPEFLDDGLFDTADPTALAPALRQAGEAVSGPADAIEPFYFWRSITQRTRRFEFAFADSDSTGRPTTAIVTARHRFQGTFNIMPVEQGGPTAPGQAVAIAKPLEDHGVRRFLLKRVRLGEEMRGHWRLAAASGASVTSAGATSEIESVRVETATQDTTLSDPLAFVFLRRVLRLAPEDSVTLTVTTPRIDDVVLLYHRDRRSRFRNNGDGTYTTRFRVGHWTGWRHFAVNVLSHGTLFDDAAPYDSKAWMFPYVIPPGPNVEYLP